VLRIIFLRPANALAIALSASCAAPGEAEPQSAPQIDYPAAPYDPTGPAVREKALEWIRANARPFTGDLDQPDELRPLLDRLNTARVIGLGELSHGDRESAATRIAIARGLIEERGVRLIGMESSIGSSNGLERFTLDRRAFPTPEAERAEASRVLLAAAVASIPAAAIPISTCSLPPMAATPPRTEPNIRQSGLPDLQ
jgi:erythromycin esterase-like protein